jgi:S1-C subfamily serine protease
MRKHIFYLFLFLPLCIYSLAFSTIGIQENIVKIYTTSNDPNYLLPWQTHGHMEWEGSGCIIGDNLILTNAHIVSNQTFIRVKRSGQPDKYIAHVKYVGHESDLAILEVKDKSFYPDVAPLEIGELPLVGDEVKVYGYPNYAEQLTITKGIVSRIGHEDYVHSSINLLCGQIDASINGGNSGGPVISNGKIAGIAMMVGWGENEGFMVPVPVISQFLQDIVDGSCNGIPDVGISVQRMENSSMRRYYGIEGEHTGILIRRIYPGSPARDILKAGDVILGIEGIDIANDGTIGLRNTERISYRFIIQNKHIGDLVTFRILRKGEIHQRLIRLTASSSSYRLVPLAQYDVEPMYYIYSGFIFSPLTENLILEFGDEWWSNAPVSFLHSYWYGEPSEGRKEVVVIVDVLSDEVTMGYEDMYYEIVYRANGRRIRDITDLIDAIKYNKNPYHVIETSQGNKIILDRKEADRGTKRILKQYKIKNDRSETIDKKHH